MKSNTKVSNQLKNARGTYRKDRATTPPVIPPTDDMPAATWISDKAAKEFAELYVELEKYKIVTGLDRIVLLVFASALDTFIDATEQIKREGMVIEKEGEGIRRANPAVKIQAAAVTTILRIADQFGMTPAARSKINVIQFDNYDADGLLT